MPRRTTVPRKLKYEVTPLNKTIDRFVVKVMLSGKRGLAERIMRETLERIEKLANRPGLEVLDLALRNATPLIEVKPRRVGGATYQVPVEVRPDRRRALAIRWLVTAARKRGENTMTEKLAGELLDASNNRGTAVKKREDTRSEEHTSELQSH